MGPVVAPFGTVAVIAVSEITVGFADLPLNDTDLAPVNPTPVRLTVVPTGPVIGSNEVI